ncbi:MAG: hypothetical protein ACFE9D_03930 [Promethearchaeota archaeon]
MCKAIINIIMFTRMLEESFKRLEARCLLANLIKVSQLQAGKNSTNLHNDSINFRRNQRMMEKVAECIRQWTGTMLLENKLSQRPCPLFIGERRSKE